MLWVQPGGAVETESIATILISIVGAMTTAKAWDYYKHRVQDKNLYRDDLRKEVTDLRLQLAEANDMIMDLTRQLAEMTIRVEFLEKENVQLREA